MSEPMKPALTREEWEAGRAENATDDDCAVYLPGPVLEYDAGHGMLGSERPHAIAALCLHNQPFGFTREDVRAVREALEHLECNCGENECFSEGPSLANTTLTPATLRSLADRIEALLPPQSQNVFQNVVILNNPAYRPIEPR